MYQMTLLSKIKSHFDAVDYFKELPFYNNLNVNNKLKPKLKRSKNIDQLAEELSIIKTDQAFKGYAMSYKVEIIEKKIQLYN